MKCRVRWGTAIVALMMLVTACSGAQMAQTPATTQPAAPQLSGEIRIDGSSTVFPITEAVAEEFMKGNKGVKVSVGISGTSGGFKKWVKGETDINDSSRKIKDSEVEEAKKLGIDASQLAHPLRRTETQSL